MRLLVKAIALSSLLIACEGSCRDMHESGRSLEARDCSEKGRAQNQDPLSVPISDADNKPSEQAEANDERDALFEALQQIDTRVTGVVMASWTELEKKSSGNMRLITAELCGGDICEDRAYIQWLRAYPQNDVIEHQQEVHVPLGARIANAKEFRRVYPCNAIELDVDDVYIGPRSQKWCLDYADRSSVQVLKHSCKELARCE